MKPKAALALLTLGMAMPGLTGCIAAALPVAAGATMLAKGKGLKGDRREPAMAESPAPDSPAAADTASGKAVITGLTALPPPAGVPVEAPGTAVTAMASYARTQALEGPDKARSALLATPGALDARRAACRSSERALFVDLDPGRGTFDPLAPGTPQPGLAAALASLRAQGIAVVWFSRLGENFSGPLRTALATSGLDADRRDQIVLMRTIDERKQTRREALADFLCPVALVGDEKADFDELYLYLKNPDAAMALDGMIGQGWFLVSPFTAPAAPTNPR